jgi:hypothetical protein
MSTSRRIGRAAFWVAIGLSLGCNGADGVPGKQGPAGAPGPAGDAGAPAVVTSEIAGTVTDGAGPLAGVSVVAQPGTATATTDAKGVFTLPGLEVGLYALAFHLDGYLDQTVYVTVSLTGPSTVAVALAVDPDAGPPPSVTVIDQLAVGFGQAVTLQATATGTGALTYAWTQVSGPAVTLTGDTTAAPSFTTQDFTAAMAPMTENNARFGVIGVNPDQAGHYAFEVAVTDAHGHVTRVTARVDATRPTSGLRMAPVGVPVWLQGDGKLVSATQAAWAWTLDTSAAPGSAATIVDPTSQFPRFTPDVMGTYAVTETVSGKTLQIYAGTWVGEMTTAAQATCTLCHNGAIAPDVFTPWKASKHYAALQRSLDGVYGASFAPEQLSRYTVGYEMSAANGGFDDVQASAGWTIPDTLQPGNWDALLATPALGQLAGIQCESCHGPQAAGITGPHANATNLDLGARISWSSDVCARCHQQGPGDDKAQQWAMGKHADLTLAYQNATVEARGTTAAHCGRCHSAQGFGQYAAQLAQGYAGLLTSDGKPPTASNAATLASLTSLGLTQATVEPQSCAACHDPHDATHPSQLRVYDAVASLPNGMTGISGAGTGMICVACHNTRNGEHSDFVAAPTAFTAPHAAAQGDTVYGFNAYYVPRNNPSPHLAIANTCAGCHAEIPTAAEKVAKHAGNHSFKVDNSVCATCHGSQVDGAAMQAAYQGQLAALGQAIDAKVLNLVKAALLPAGGGAYAARVWDPGSDDYSSPAAANVTLTTAPTSIGSFEIHGQVGFILHLPAAVTVALVDAKGNAAGSVTTADLYVQAGSLQNATATAPLFAAGSDYLKASWNYYLLHADNTKGVHNPGFYDAVLAATNARVNALP